MDRNPHDPSPDEDSATSSGEPADERSLPPTAATEFPPTVASPFPPTASGSDRPAGSDSLPTASSLRFEPDPLPPVSRPPSTISPVTAGEATPPPPPPPPTVGRPAARAEAPSAPPSLRPLHPPTTANPPRPGDGITAAATLNSPPPASAGGTPPLGSRRRRWRVAVGVLVGLLMAASLVSGGIVIGSSLSDESASTTPVRVDGGSQPASADGSGAASQPVVPLVDDDSDEPVADVAAAVAPSVVLIGTDVGQGSGIVWDAENGYIVTNDHVTSDANTVIVQFADGNRVSGTVVGGDSARDIAVVQVDPSEADLVAASFAPTASVEVGQLAVAIGSPFGLDQSVTAGIVSAVNRINEYGGSDPANPVDVEMIQTDAPINPGNSGGALADRNGLVIGMNTQIRTDGVTTGNVGVGFAVPSDTILLIAERIVAGESLELAHLGVSGESPTDGTVGALVTGVVEGAPAEQGGIQAGDLIVSLDGELIGSMAELSAEVKLFRPDDTVEIEFLRDGERLRTAVTLGTG